MYVDVVGSIYVCPPNWFVLILYDFYNKCTWQDIGKNLLAICNFLLHKCLSKSFTRYKCGGILEYGNMFEE